MIDQQTVVAVARGEDSHATIREAVGRDLEEIVRPGDRVLLKVNQVAGFAPERGSTVSAETVGLVAQMVLQAGAASVGIAEDAGRTSDTMEVFHDLGTDEVARRVGAELVDLRRHPHRMERVPGGGLVAGEIDYALPLLACDRLIGVTKLKTHHQAGITAAMKNMFGAVSDDFKRRFHRSDLGAAIVDINSIRHPDYTIVDGFPAMEGVGPHMGPAVPMNVAIAGRDPVAVDAVCAAVMGFAPDWARSLSLAGERGLGVADLERIRIRGLPIAQVARPFKTPLQHFKELLAGNVEIVDGTACSGCSCVVGTVFMLLLGRYGQQISDFQGIRVYLGKLDDVPDLDDEQVFAVGKCVGQTAGCAGHGRHIPGCPPTITEVMNLISRADQDLTAFGNDVR